MPNMLQQSQSKVYLKDVEALDGGVDDIHESGTYSGNILIGSKSISRLPHIYDIQMLNHYKGAALGELNPHVFTLGDVVFHATMNKGKSNSILVSGESGASKNKTIKCLCATCIFGLLYCYRRTNC
ncbi:Myosin-9 [Bienertia sinuspersici]